jgi:hypothetical protein
MAIDDGLRRVVQAGLEIERKPCVSGIARRLQRRGSDQSRDERRPSAHRDYDPPRQSPGGADHPTNEAEPDDDPPVPESEGPSPVSPPPV